MAKQKNNFITTVHKGKWFLLVQSTDILLNGHLHITPLGGKMFGIILNVVSTKWEKGYFTNVSFEYETQNVTLVLIFFWPNCKYKKSLLCKNMNKKHKINQMTCLFCPGGSHIIKYVMRFHSANYPLSHVSIGQVFS